MDRARGADIPLKAPPSSDKKRFCKEVREVFHNMVHLAGKFWYSYMCRGHCKVYMISKARCISQGDGTERLP